MNDREKYTYQWPDNLVKEILPHDQFMQWILKPPKNCVALFHYMVCVSLRPFEADIVCRRSSVISKSEIPSYVLWVPGILQLLVIILL